MDFMELVNGKDPNLEFYLFKREVKEIIAAKWRSYFNSELCSEGKLDSVNLDVDCENGVIKSSIYVLYESREDEEIDIDVDRTISDELEIDCCLVPEQKQITSQPHYSCLVPEQKQITSQPHYSDKYFILKIDFKEIFQKYLKEE